MAETLSFTTGRFDRELKKLVASHPDSAEHYAAILGSLKADPFNRSRRYRIEKLRGMPAGEGQYRIRSGHYQFRYEIEGPSVYLKACSLPREDTY